MKRIFKKNQIMITLLAIMIAVAGYLNFAGKGANSEEIAEAQNTITDEDGVALVDISDDDIESLENEFAEIGNEFPEEEMADAQTDDLNAFISETVDSEYVENQLAAQLTNTTEMTVDDVPGEAVFTSATAVGSLSGAKLLKEQTRSKNKETLMEIINNTAIGEEQKKSAIDQMVELTSIAEQETSAEILLEAKGFSDVVVSISNGAADVMVSMNDLTESQCAQILDIVQRKTGLEASNIIITPIGE